MGGAIMKRLLCLVTVLCMSFLVSCGYKVVKNDGKFEKIITDDGTVYYYSEISVACCYSLELDELKSNVVAEIEYDDGTYDKFAISPDENIGILYGYGLEDHPFLFVKEGYDMPSITESNKVEALYYIPYDMYNSSRNEESFDENYYENFRLPIEQNAVVEFINGLSQYIATDTERYGGDTYYGYLVVKYSELDLFFRYIVWSKDGFDSIQIQGDSFNEELGTYDYYIVPAEYINIFPLVE